jgi:hypothetical protein
VLFCLVFDEGYIIFEWFLFCKISTLVLNLVWGVWLRIGAAGWQPFLGMVMNLWVPKMQGILDQLSNF